VIIGKGHVVHGMEISIDRPQFHESTTPRGRSVPWTATWDAARWRKNREDPSLVVPRNRSPLAEVPRGYLPAVMVSDCALLVVWTGDQDVLVTCLEVVADVYR
jgi:hypothetical protein